MARLPRYLPPGLPAHVLHRGNNRQRIFHSDGDFLFFIHCLHEAFALAKVRMHAYVLMPNHVHLLMTPDEPGAASRFMQSAVRRYAGYFNRRHARSGTMWEGRFHSTSIQEDRYLFACHRYMDMNPVRAGIAQRPGQYRWCSFLHHAGGQPDSLVTPHPLIESLGRTEAARHGAYRALFEVPLDAEVMDAIRAATMKGAILGAPHAPRRTGRPPKRVSDTGFIVNSPDRERPAAGSR